MDFMEAVKAMKEGKKVRLDDWDKPRCFFEIKETLIIDETGKPPTMLLSWIEATDWEIVEDKKTLSDYWIQIIPNKGLCYPEDKVKEAIKEFIDYWIDIGGVIQPVRLKEKAKEIFGDRLV